MSFDVSKLMPVNEWSVDYEDGSIEGLLRMVHHGNINTVTKLGENYPLNDLHFIEESRQAFDVMMQMGWGVAFDEDDGWFVTGKDSNKLSIVIQRDRYRDRYLPTNWSRSPFGTNPIEAILKTWEWWEANKHREVKS